MRNSMSRPKHGEVCFRNPANFYAKHIYVYSTVVNRSEQCGPKRVKPTAWDGPEGRLCVMTVRDAFCIGSFLLFPLDFLLRMWE